MYKHHKEYERICIKEGDACEVAPLCIAWLEKQGKQKPIWSEEDEQMIQDIIEAIDTQYSVSDYKGMVDWLKSLKQRMKV